MGGEGKDIASEGKGFLRKRISRRGAIKLGAKGAGAAFVAHSFLRGAKANVADARTKGGAVLESSGRFLKGEGSPGEVLETLVGRQPTYLHLVYPNLSSEDMDIAKREVFEEEKMLVDLDRVARTARYESLIRNTAKEHGVPEELLVGLAMYESEGWVNYNSEDGCKGLTAMGDDIALKHNLKISDGDDDDRFDPDKLLPATASELREYFEQLGDWGFAFQEWHVGQDQLYNDLLRPHFATAYGEELPSIYVELANDTEEAKAAAILETQKRLELYKQKIAQYGVTVYHLFKNPQIQEAVSGSGWEGTQYYLPRIIGSYAAFQGNKAIAMS